MAAAVVAMPVALALPSEADLPYEEDVLRDPHSIRPWRRYLAARAAAPLQERAVIYERAVRALPGSYKLWHAYLLERTAAAARAKPHCGEHPANEAIALMRQATAEPSAEVKLRAAAAAAGDDEPAQLKLHKSAKLWSFYVDLEESLGALASTRAAYEGAMAARAATPQMVINYASFLEERGYFEDSFAAYETGANLFGHPHSKPIWDTYLERFVARHGGSKAERARELFAEATRRAPPHDRARLFLRHARYEEEFGSAARHGRLRRGGAVRAGERQGERLRGLRGAGGRAPRRAEGEAGLRAGDRVRRPPSPRRPGAVPPPRRARGSAGRGRPRSRRVRARVGLRRSRRRRGVLGEVERLRSPARRRAHLHRHAPDKAHAEAREDAWGSGEWRTER
ncbi:XPA-binding protein 2-like [Oryza sativa Japonica Group]|uniref:XPA-binding protein 2-like n=1 Tax=Oryza sativa subsp. japonica TaxID=39947 RepID=Q5N7M2_ORYSJ|nr:hypothetical protein EE612_005055 [Oryza sativa]BAD82527.1 XPA-binding protein 2-like [Oryza sativa Japonica Group]BAD82534.1 XPA-binding protein 2-like [Oryza sativa Japonica Group]